MTFRRTKNNKFVGEKESEDDIFEGKFVCEIWKRKGKMDDI